MGGGSADAAAAMLAAASAWGATNYEGSLISAGATVGADVPFALMGGAAIGMGTGHELTELAQASKLHWVLVPNEFGLSTPKVFAELDRMRAQSGQDPTAVAQAAIDAKLVAALEAGASAEEIAPLLHNDLQAAAVSLRPELQEILNLADKVFALKAIISGSGPTIAMLARDANDAIAIASRLRTYGQQAIVTSSPAGAAQLVL
jgi:4-diphosphocytidyl-2-C-methyl-D-erythritol kinase